MFNFTNLSESSQAEEEVYNPGDYRVSFEDFLERRRTSERPFVFDLRSPEEYEESHLSGSYNLPFEYFESSIYQMPYQGDLLLYGNGRGEVEKAGEMLYENGFDVFAFIESYDDLIDFLMQATFEITAEAKEFVQKADASQWVYLAAQPISPKRASYECFLKDKQDLASHELILEHEGMSLCTTHETLLYLKQTKIDVCNNELIASNQTWEVPPLKEGETIESVTNRLLAEEINPMVAGHGGYVEFLKAEEGNIYLIFGGGCHGCSMSAQTLKLGVEKTLKENIPDVKEIIDATDHTTGENPYYT